MPHAHAMAGRLPALYAEGELTAAVLGVPGIALEIADEDLVAVQRSHWFDRAVERDDAAKLAAVLDLEPESWQGLRTFRAWLHALRDALLLEGAVTVGGIRRFVRDYAGGFQEALRVAVLPPLDRFEPQPSDVRGAIVEQPPRRREVRAPASGGVEPLHRFAVRQTGLFAAPAAVLLTGLPEGPEHVPVVVNLTTREAVVFRGTVGVGERLWLVPRADGTLAASLEHRDVSDRAVSVAPAEPGHPWEEAAVTAPARALTLLPGANELWFLPVAHFDLDGLDRFLLALADLELRLGRWDETAFDHSLFDLDAAVALHVAWTEREPAAFDVSLPAGTLRHAAGAEAGARAARDQLAASLQASVGRLRGAGVRAGVTLRPFAEVQRAHEHLTGTAPLRVAPEIGPTGADALPEPGGVLDVTPFDDSTYR
ncbi:MAG TPA: hypothetical protein VLA98_13300 [Solirubrobacteraceae bacterium]|nr:hypothetical protein [Solirubrobacteraceae bacterium]